MTGKNMQRMSVIDRFNKDFIALAEISSYTKDEIGNMTREQYWNECHSHGNFMKERNEAK